MVLVGNEWQNKCEDVPKTTDNTAADGNNTTSEATTSTPAISAAGSIEDHLLTVPGVKHEEGYLINSTTVAAPGESTYRSKLNVKDKDDISDSKITEIEDKLSLDKNLKAENLKEPAINHNNSSKIMAENTKEFPIKEAIQDQLGPPQSLMNNHYTDNNKDAVESNLLYSATNTLTLATQRENNRQQSALQTALNATNNANNTNISVAAAGLQPNFLSQLALTATVVGLQKSTTSSNNLLESTVSTTSVPAPTYDNNGQAKIVLICEGNSHPFQTRSISLTPNVECMVGRLIAKSKASENNAIFDCKVLSRKHAVIWYTPDGKFWVKDTKSSNGTFINDNKLSEEEAELHFGDIVKFGVDVLENSRKEVHGCIIACVKLYMPDGREAISIESSTHRSHFSGEGRISFDELHRLNLYIQETAQREKVLTSKLCNLQNVLDSTRKKSALCWQSMITEDQLLHRIQSLEKKLQFMEKNVPDNVLRSEVMKLLDEKSSYQHTAKEALRKVYQERCDAIQMLAKMESAYSQSDSECALLRDQIMNSKQTLQDVNSRLLRLETEYNDYKDEVDRQQQEMNERGEQRISEMTEKLRERELECKDLTKKISDLLIKRSELLEDEQQLLEKEAIENLDAAIADMDLGDDENSSEDEVEGDTDVNDFKITKDNEENDTKGVVAEDESNVKFALKIRKSNARPQLSHIFGDALNGVDGSSPLKKATALEVAKTNNSSPKRVKETTIMKWLQNSDLNKNEFSFDIFKAICSENEDDQIELKDAKPLQIQNTLAISETDLFPNFRSKLKNVQINLKQLEDEIKSETNNETCVADNVHFKEESDNVESESSDEDDAAASAEKDFIINKNGKTDENQVLSKENKKYLLLKSSVDMLREAYNEIWDSVKEKDEKQEDKLKTQATDVQSNKSSSKAIPELDSPTALLYAESDNTESDSEVESLSQASPVHSSFCGTVVASRSDKAHDQLLMARLKEKQSQIEALNEKLKNSEMDAQHTLEIMQVECEDLRLKIQSLNEIIEALKSDKSALQLAVSDNQNNMPPKPKTFTDNNELEEDSLFNAINVTALEHEEELITYKERLDEQEKENIALRNEISLIRRKANAEFTKDVMLRQYLPYCVIVLAILIYFTTRYY